MNSDNVAKLTPRRKPKPAPNGHPDDGRPVIHISAELHDVVDRAVDAIAKHDPDLYQRDGHLVQVVPAADEPSIAAWEPGTPQVRPLSKATLRERLTRAARWFKCNAVGEWKPSTPSDNVTEAVLDRGAWSGIPRLVSVIEAPSFRVDGTIVDEPGYDPKSGLLFAPSITFEPVPAAPTQDDAVRARAELAEVFADFPYRAPVDLDVAIACMLTILARPMIRGSVPAFGFDASTRGSGKSLQTDAIAIIPTGRGAARMNWPAREEELEKILGAYAVRGATLVSFDNVASNFGGAPLDRCLTATDRVELRVLGKTQIPSVQWRAVVMATGNNIIVTGDTCRRVLLSRLEPGVERPEERTDFRHPNLLAWVRSERARLVRAALTMIAAYLAAGRPKCGPRNWGSFEAWAALIPQAIAFAGGADIMTARPEEAEGHDPEAGALVVLLDAIEKLDPKRQGITAKALLGLLYTIERLKGRDVPPDGYDDARNAIEALVPTEPGKAPNCTKLGRAIARFKGRIVGGRRLHNAGNYGGVQRWTVMSRGGVSGVSGDGGTCYAGKSENQNHPATTSSNPTNPTNPTSPGDGQLGIDEWPGVYS